MNRNRFLLGTLVGIVAVGFAASAAKKPNVIMINVNDTNDFLGYMESLYSDQAKTPNFDRLAAKGVAFLNAHCATPSCTPSRHALFYGKYPFNTGLYRYNFDMRELEPILNDRIPGFKGMNIFFKENGYTTYGLGHNLGINPEFATGTEWDHVGHAGDQAHITLDPKQSFVSAKN